MTSGDLATPPAWVVPGVRAVADAHRIAYARATGARMADRVHAGGVASALNWVTGGEVAPVTHRPGPVPAELARSEWRIAGSVETGAPLPAVARLECAATDPVIVDPRWAAGAGAALGWLLGFHARPPVDIPTRLPDGRVPTADELYERILADRPRAAWTPEQRAHARRRAEQTAAASRSLAELADRV